jgi:hypothetical protein
MSTVHCLKQASGEKPHFWKACQILIPIEVSFGMFMDANHIRKIVVRLAVEIIEDLRDTEKKVGVYFKPRHLERGWTTSPSKSTAFSCTLIFM